MMQDNFVNTSRRLFSKMENALWLQVVRVNFYIFKFIAEEYPTRIQKLYIKKGIILDRWWAYFSANVPLAVVESFKGDMV